MLIRSTPSSTDSKTSGPNAYRAFWLVQLLCLRYTHLKPSRHLHIVANKRYLLLRVRLCDQYWRVRGREHRPWLLLTLA